MSRKEQPKYLPDGTVNPLYRVRPSGKHLKRIAQIARDPGRLVSLDGEGVSDPNGRHRYILLAAVSGDNEISYITPSNGRDELTTAECLGFIMSIPADRSICIFSGGYDVAMMARDLPEHKLEQFAHGDEINYAGFRIRYLPRKELWIKYRNDSRIVYDVFGYFQTSFINSLDAWNVGMPEERQRIRDMKEKRGEFANETEQDILRYCLEENQLACKLMHNLCVLMNEAKLYPARLSGVGPLATYVLKREKVLEYHARKEPTESLGWHAYYGGRFDVAAAGHFRNVYDYDINSAYPFQLTRLPCLAHGEWNHTSIYESNHKVALWHISWDTPRSTKWPPFPWREANGSVYYPTSGAGWYWQDEIREGIRLIERAGGSFTIGDGFYYHHGCDHRPFGFIETLYEMRREYKRRGNPVEKVLKLAYNSQYGKTAQTIGFKVNEDGEITPPAWQSTVWSGMVTSGTRAQIIRMLTDYGESIISVATDGIVSVEKLPYENATGLGEWEATAHEEIWLIQPGLYYYPNENKSKTRGHSARELNWEEITKAWKSGIWLEDDTFGWHYRTTKFVGLALGIRAGMREHFRRWRELPNLTIHFAPARRMIGGTKTDVKKREQCIWYPSPWHGGSESTPYHPKGEWGQRHKALYLEQLIGHDQP